VHYTEELAHQTRFISVGACVCPSVPLFNYGQYFIHYVMIFYKHFTSVVSLKTTPL